MTVEELQYLIQTERTKRGWSRQRLGDLVGVSGVTIKSYEDGTVLPRSFRTLHKILLTLGYELTVIRRHDDPLRRKE